MKVVAFELRGLQACQGYLKSLECGAKLAFVVGRLKAEFQTAFDDVQNQERQRPVNEAPVSKGHLAQFEVSAAIL